MLKAKITHGFAIVSRDEKGAPVFQTVTREAAKNYLKLTSCTKVRTGLTGYRVMILANGTSLRVERFVRGRVVSGKA